MNTQTNRRVRTVFCATDFSETAALAQNHAMRIARRHGASVVLGHVIEPRPVVPYPLLVEPPDGVREVRGWVQERLNNEVDSIRETGLNASIALGDGRPGPRLVELAESTGADLFVIGTRGLSGIEHFILGSTAEYVARRCGCPVLTVHSGDAPPPNADDTIIIATDLSGEALEAAAAFINMADEETRPQVLLVFADSTPPYFEPFRHEMLARWHRTDSRKEGIEASMRPTVEMIRAAGYEVETTVLDGDPVRSLTHFAEERGVKLIILNTHGRSAFMEALTARHAQRIIQHAPCPVLTVRSSSEKEGNDV